jgi:hypothetical protein
VLRQIETLIPAGLRPWILLAHLAATLYLSGVIWTVQLAYYPLFARVGPDAWTRYHAGHTARMTWVVLVPMLVELGASGLLAAAPPAGVSQSLAGAGFGLAVLTWAATFFVSVPLHGRLARGWDARAHRALVSTNWFRTVLWSAHALLALEMVRRVLPPSLG